MKAWKSTENYKYQRNTADSCQKLTPFRPDFSSYVEPIPFFDEYITEVMLALMPSNVSNVSENFHSFSGILLAEQKNIWVAWKSLVLILPENCWD